MIKYAVFTMDAEGFRAPCFSLDRQRVMNMLSPFLAVAMCGFPTGV